MKCVSHQIDSDYVENLFNRFDVTVALFSVQSVVQSDDGPGGLLKKLSWLCKAALVLLQSVVGSPEIPTFRSLIRCTYRVLTFSGHNFDLVTDITF